MPGQSFTNGMPGAADQVENPCRQADRLDDFR